MKFFVPDRPEGKSDEEVLAALAAVCQCPVPALGDRVYSITYRHDGEDWTSTVGKRSEGVRTRTVGRGSAAREVSTRLSDPSTVLAIFPGGPYIVITDGARGSSWSNPFYMGAGQITHVEKFSDPTIDLSGDKTMYVVMVKYEFADRGDPEYSTPLFAGSKAACHEWAAKEGLVPGYNGPRHVTATSVVVVQEAE